MNTQLHDLLQAYDKDKAHETELAFWLRDVGLPPAMVAAHMMGRLREWVEFFGPYNAMEILHHQFDGAGMWWSTHRDKLKEVIEVLANDIYYHAVARKHAQMLIDSPALHRRDKAPAHTLPKPRFHF